MPMMDGYMWGWGGLWMLLFWVFVIAGVVWLVLTVSRQQTRGGGSESDARRILEERFARGEIDAEEFRARRAALEESRR